MDRDHRGATNYGATVRKMILRIVGGVLGGLLVLAVMIVASPNFESVGSYFAAFFVAIFLCAYLSPSSGSSRGFEPSLFALYRGFTCGPTPDRLRIANVRARR